MRDQDVARLLELAESINRRLGVIEMAIAHPPMVAQVGHAGRLDLQTYKPGAGGAMKREGG